MARARPSSAAASATSNVLTGEMFGIPIKGTHAHSWVMSFPTELDAFRAYAEVLPHQLPVAGRYLRHAQERHAQRHHRIPASCARRAMNPAGIRLDSGDLAYLSREARQHARRSRLPGREDLRLRRPGRECSFAISRLQGACIDIWGVGTKLITSADCPALGGVYKLSAELVERALCAQDQDQRKPGQDHQSGREDALRVYSSGGSAWPSPT